MKFIKQFGLSLVILGGTFLINENKWGLIFLIPGGVLFATYTFLSGFEEPIKQPNWELVYPELSLGFSEDLEDETPEIDKKKS